MKCCKCGAELGDDTRFCSYCGTKISEKTTVDESVVKYAGETIQEEVEMEYKGTQYADTSKSPLGDKAESKLGEFWNRLSLFGKLFTVSVAISAFLCVISFLAGRIFAGIITIVWLAVVFVALLMRKNVIKVSKMWMPLGVVILSFVLIVPYFGLFKVNMADYEKYDWSEVVLADMLPTPDSPYGEIISNSDSYLALYVNKATQKQYAEYIEECKESGFTVDADKSENRFSAKNADGYKLSIEYQRNKIIYISLETTVGTSKPSTDATQQDTTDYTLDYVDAASFEKALNDGVKVNGKVVQFEVLEYKPDSALGINCWAGEHLNFISEKELDVGNGNVIVGRITEEASKSLGSWIIYYDVLAIGGEKIEKTDESQGEETTEPTASEITLTMSEEDFKGMNYQEAEKIFREMGFTKFEYETIETEDINKPDDTIGAVEIKNWTLGTGDFEVGDIYDSDTIVVLWYYICDEPESNLTVDNCPELAEMLSNTAEIDETYSLFAAKYSGRIIEFDGRIDYCTNHESYNTRFDYLVSAGDYNPDHQIGPYFKFEDVNYYDLNTDLDMVSVGLNVRIIAEVISFDSNSGLFYLDPVSVTGR